MSRLRQVQAQHLKPAAIFAGNALRYSIYLVSLLTVIAASALGVLVAQQLNTVPDLAFLQNYHPVDAIEMYDKNDQLICAINKEDTRKTVDINHISKYMKDAVLAAEDHHFYEHHGINFFSIMRALTVNMVNGKVLEGGSTITQQLVKNLFFPETGRTLVRKISEAIVAEQIESRYTKDEILCMYLNEIYFGNGAHGIEQAAHIYFGKSALELNIGESAFLAAVIKAPSVNGSYEHRADTLVRKNEILKAMREFGYISEAQANHGINTPIAFSLNGNRVEAAPFTKHPYYVSYVLDLVHRHFDDNQIRRSGLRVYTNLDPVAQTAAEQTLARHLKVAPHGIDEEALVSISVKDGAVRAIVGGAGDYWKNQWNCATNAHTVGSAFKPFVYLTAFLQRTLRSDSIIEDSPVKISQVDMVYSPKNYDGKYQGKLTVRQALARSRNTCAIKVAQRVGIENVVSTAKLLGLDEDLKPNLSLALGSCALSPLKMAAAYGTLARGGIDIKPWTVRHIDDLNGRELESYGPISCRVAPEQPVAEIVDIMQDVVTSGTGTLARLSDRPVAGKTGTADQSRDLWFIGFTPDMVTAVWGGNKNNEAIADKHVTGGSVMARVWRDYNSLYYRQVPTAAGELVAVKAKKRAPDVAEVSRTRIYSRETPAQNVTRVAQYTHAVSNPSHGVVLRNMKGVTEYAWTR